MKMYHFADVGKQTQYKPNQTQFQIPKETAFLLFPYYFFF